MLLFRIGVAMKKSSALQRCAVHGGSHGGANGSASATAATGGNTAGNNPECETEVSYNKGRQAVVRMLGKCTLIG